MKALWVSCSRNDQRGVPRQYIRAGRCLVLCEIRMSGTEGGGPWATTHLLELWLDSPSPLVSLKILAILTYFNMWSPEIRGHEYLTGLNLPPSFPWKHRLFVTEDSKRCISSGEGDITKKVGKGDGGFHLHWPLGTWWWHSVLTSSGHGHMDRESTLLEKAAIFVYFTILFLYELTVPFQQVAGEYSNDNTIEWNSMSWKVQFALPAKINKKQKSIEEEDEKHLKNKNPENTKASRNKDFVGNSVIQTQFGQLLLAVGRILSPSLRWEEKIKVFNFVSEKFGVILILCVNLIGLRGAQTFGQTSSWVFLWGFWVSTFKLIDWVKLIALPNMDGPHLINSKTE